MKGGTWFLGQSCHSRIEVGTAMADDNVGWVVIGKQGRSDLDHSGVAPAKMIVGSLVVCMPLALTMVVRSLSAAWGRVSVCRVPCANRQW